MAASISIQFINIESTCMQSTVIVDIELKDLKGTMENLVWRSSAVTMRRRIEEQENPKGLLHMCWQLELSFLSAGHTKGWGWDWGWENGGRQFELKFLLAGCAEGWRGLGNGGSQCAVRRNRGVNWREICSRVLLLLCPLTFFLPPPPARLLFSPARAQLFLAHAPPRPRPRPRVLLRRALNVFVAFSTLLRRLYGA